MILVSLNRIRKYFGPDPVLDGATLDVRPGQRIGLVGPNGAGKTTLLKIMTGMLEADAGEVVRHPSARVGFLEQQPRFDPAVTVWDVAEAGLGHLTTLTDQLEQVSHEMAQADEEDRAALERRYDDLQHQLSQEDAYNIEHRITRVLDGLRFTPDQYQQTAATLSGGQQNRLLLAKLLLESPDLMLLDEPSNHLDIETTQWLESFLRQSTQAMIVVSHDRYLLDQVCTHTGELFAGTIELYTGNFSAYWRQKDERLEVTRRTFEKQQAEREKLADFVRKHHAGQKSAQAEDRRKKLERLEEELVDPPREISAPPMGFPQADRCGDIALRVEHLEKGFTAEPLFRDTSFEIARGERWGILGPNGSGKTTLLKCVVGQLPPDHGGVHFGHNVRAGYFDQQLASVDSNAAVMDAVRPDHKELLEPQRRDLLAKFGITGDAALQQVETLSGGQRTRAALARLAAQDPNLMVLDEPTNHLDLWALDALERSLLNFGGTLLFVTHDRYFLNRIADHLLVYDNGGFKKIHGNYDTFLHLEAVKREEASSNNDAPSAEGSSSKKKSKSAQVKRKRKFPFRKVQDLEVDIADTEAEVESLEASLADPEVYSSADKIKEVKATIESRREQLLQLYEHWEEACELN